MPIIKRIRENIDRLEYTLLPRFYFKDKCYVVLYHCVSPQKHYLLDNMSATIWTSTKDFADQIRYIAHHYHVASIGELIKGKIDREAVIITFDDGFRDVLNHAYPVLEKFNLPFTICINSNFVQNLDMLWLSKLNILRRRGLFETFCNRYSYPPTISKFMNNLEVNNNLNHFLAASGIDIEEISTHERLYLSQDDVKKMNPDLATILPHTHTHFKTTDLNYSQRKKEIEASIRYCQKTLPEYYQPIFSFPFGSPGKTFDQIDIDILKEYKIFHYLSAGNGIMTLGKTAFEIKRKSIYENQSLSTLKYFIEKPQLISLTAKRLKNIF